MQVASPVACWSSNRSSEGKSALASMLDRLCRFPGDALGAFSRIFRHLSCRQQTNQRGRMPYASAWTRITLAEAVCNSANGAVCKTLLHVAGCALWPFQHTAHLQVDIGARSQQGADVVIWVRDDLLPSADAMSAAAAAKP
jgi:hypothetical protein